MISLGMKWRNAVGAGLSCVLLGAVLWSGCSAPPTTNPPVTTKNISCDDAKKICEVSGKFTENATFKAENTYVLKGAVVVGEDNVGRDDASKKIVLTIEAGTKIVGSTESLSFLQINRGGKVMAQGTKDKPIVFTSAKAEGERLSGDWGGVIMNGWAPVNVCTQNQTSGVCEAVGEGDTGAYGGDKPEDSSGVLKYVRIEFAGRKITDDKELNGLSLQGVGSDTTLEYIQTHLGKDDGIEFFGGTVNLRYALITGPDDDGLDWTNGWSGKAQFIIVQQYDSIGDNGIEADNNEKKMDASPRSKPLLANITIVGSPNSSNSDVGVLLRHGTAAKIWNAVVTGFNETCVMIDSDETLKTAFSDAEFKTLSGELTMTHSTINCAKPYKEPCKTLDEAGKCKEQYTDVVKAWFDGQEGNKAEDPMLGDPTNPTAPDFKPKAGSPVLSGAADPSTVDPWFQKVDFRGAIGTEDWTKGWTTAAAK